MTAIEIAKEFIKTMNPENVTNGSANFAVYKQPLTDRFNLELYFIEEDFDDDESTFKTTVDLVDKRGNFYDYTFADTMTDAEAIASGIEYLFDKWGVFASA